MKRKLKLLIADDEEVVRKGMCKYIQLHSERFDSVYMAENGQKAIDQIILYRPDIMILDIRMPIKDGIAVMEEAARLEILPATIVLSGYDEFKYAQQAIHYGAKDYLLKPARSSDILNLVNHIADEIAGKSKGESVERQQIPTTVIKAEAYIREHYHEDISAQTVAEYVGITPGYLSTLFSQYCSCGFSEMITRTRLERACTYLSQSYLKTYEIAYKVGFRDEKYFSKVFKKAKGITPAEYRRSCRSEGM
ncbi:response regulator transcription factor [Hespellia stercorisuis]|uniref:Stage 0 sporulation protein A homolog n=1 Tax=Hespellia stercorisuis DSM 15480 TaxID=1121950 RepID=A0A1M6RC48_9FIRM|nr:response regulator [Hespellia stercorisuis]SHK29907.1 Helix-turn-helix domain-containing protein [Hespellia stercorisuis DSM 15480]